MIHQSINKIILYNSIAVILNISVTTKKDKWLMLEMITNSTKRHLFPFNNLNYVSA